MTNARASMESFKPEARIGLLLTGHEIYWEQFPELKSLGMGMSDKLKAILGGLGKVVSTELVDNAAKAEKASRFLVDQDVDIVVVFPLGYTASMQIIPAVKDIRVPIVLLNAHEDSSYDYRSADTTVYLHHEGVCCIPEYSNALVNLGKKFKVRTGHFGDPRLIRELTQDIEGCAAATAFRRMNIGLIGQLYTNMSDMTLDENRLVRATGKMLVHPEIEEIEEAFAAVSPGELKEMYAQIRAIYDVDETVTNEHLHISARLAVAYERVITRHNIGAFGYFWWGVKDSVTQMRAQSSIAVSRLAAMGMPGVTEGDVKNAMGMKILNLLGAGGMFTEFFSMDFDENFILMGHDGPSNIIMARDRPRLQHLDVHHGKTGHGLGIDFDLRPGPVTLLTLTQDRACETFKMVYTVGSIVEGETLHIGNPNCRIRVKKPIHDFIDEWCQQGPSHHASIGYGDKSIGIEAFARASGFGCVRI
jgi:L-arabinose isomerase